MELKKHSFIIILLLIFPVFFACARTPREAVPAAGAEPVLEESRLQEFPEEPAGNVAVEEEEESEEAVPPAAGEASTEENAGNAEAAEEEIPLVEPKKTEVRKAYVEPTLKILIIRETDSIVLKSDAEMTLRFDGRTLKIGPDENVKFKRRSARVGVETYPVGIATFRGTEYEKAVQFAEKWRRDGYTVRIIKAGGPFVHDDGTVVDTTVYWVALGSFKKKEQAERFRNKMNTWGLSAWVMDESVLNPKGNVEIVDADGNILAYADSHVTLAGEKPLEIKNVPFGDGFWNSGRCEDRSYLSPLEIFIDKQGGLSAINLVNLEEYVKGVVPVEIRLKAPDEALKAQAISARTEALAKLGIKHVFDPYDFCASQHCQEFGGLARRTERTDNAVDATRGMVLMRGDTLIDAVYSANCGGHTENNENVWSSRPEKTLRGVSELFSNPDSFDSPIPSSQLAKWLKTTPHAYCADPRAGSVHNFRWRVSFTAKKMNRAVNRYYRVGTVKDIRVLRRGVSGRALRVRIVGSRDSVTIYKELEIRRVLGHLKSTMFLLEIRRDSSGNPTSFRFRGGGWGHGVGMCQAGAEGMALRGFSCDAILKHYFTGAEIKQLYK